MAKGVKVIAMYMNKDAGTVAAMAAGRIKSRLVLKNAKIVNVFTGEVNAGDVAIDEGMIVGIGTYQGETEVSLEGRYVVPGLIDGHMHIESSMVLPGEFSNLVVPLGTTTVIADPHEIANVCGLEGIRFLLEQSKDINLDVYMMMPSCVPATPFDNPGSRLDAHDMKELLDDERILGLGEVMDFRGVVEGRADIYEKISLFKGRVIDGHAPGLSGKALNAYAAAGIRTEHECGNTEEMLEKLRLGFYILIREGSAAHDLASLTGGITAANMRRCLFCTDDRHLADIVAEGHIDNNVRMAIRCGIDPIWAVTMATLNTAECYGLMDRGAVAPGYLADLVVLDDLAGFKIHSVYKKGRKVEAAQNRADGEETNREETVRKAPISNRIADTVRIKQVTADMLKIPLTDGTATVIEIVPGKILTRKVKRTVDIKDGYFEFTGGDSPLKLAVVDRHRGSGDIGVGLLGNFGLKNGAVATTISHDSHNLIVAGDNDRDIMLAISELAAKKGGITLCSGGKVTGTLSLPAAGLLSEQPYGEVLQVLGEMLKAAHDMGVPEDIEPFMTLSFLALTVIPEIRLTERGLFDVEGNSFIIV